MEDQVEQRRPCRLGSAHRNQLRSGSGRRGGRAQIRLRHLGRYGECSPADGNFGAPGKVNISESTYQLISEKFYCHSRGKIDVKGKGELEMFFVEGEKT